MLIVIPIGASIIAIVSANILLLNYVPVFTSILWTGMDIFMLFLLGPIFRKVSLSTRKLQEIFIIHNHYFFYNFIKIVINFDRKYLFWRRGDGEKEYNFPSTKYRVVVSS